MRRLGGVCRERGGQRGGCTQFAHGRSRMTIDPRILTMPGRSTSGFHQPGRHCLHQARSAVRCSASPMKGELPPSKNRSKDGLTHHAPTFLLMGGSGGGEKGRGGGQITKNPSRTRSSRSDFKGSGKKAKRPNKTGGQQAAPTKAELLKPMPDPPPTPT